MMAKPFRLATVLRVRRLQEDMARQGLAFANMTLAAAAADRDRRVDHFRSLGSTAGLQSFHEFLQEEQTKLFAVESVSFGNTKVNEAELHAAEWRQQYLAARKKVRSLERLEVRKRREQDVIEDRRATRAIDDLVTTRWAGQMAGVGTAERRAMETGR